ncbi:MAG: GNAT family N-acetyltransferase [Thermoplasmata archaeon]|nr:GNAT family N-acetyltransferase [Thermoplasmata archaeon]
MTTRTELCLLELWCRCTGLADRTVRSSLPRDERLLNTTRTWIRDVRARAARPVIVRVESDNPFGTLLANRFGWSLATVLLLATRPTRGFPPVSPPAGYRLRRYELGDARAFAQIHRDAFQQIVPAGAYHRWAQQPNCETFSATRNGEVVGLMIAELRRGGELGDFNLAVATEHRGRGLGPALLAVGVGSLRRRGARRVVADYWATNGPAVSLYRRYDFHIERAYSYFRAG